MKQINVTIQRIDSDFRIADGLPGDYGLPNVSVLVTFIYRQIHLTAWAQEEQLSAGYKTVFKQLIQIAKIQADHEMSV